MESQGNINSSITGSLIDNIKHPFILIDASANIIHHNKEADELFKLQGTINFFDLLQDESSVDFKKTIEKTILHNDLVLTTDFLFRSGIELKLKLYLKTFRENKNLYILCSFVTPERSLGAEGLTGLKLNTAEVKQLVSDDKLSGILNQVTASYPFTFMGKEKIRNLINNLDNVFWVRDDEGNIVLVNNKFAEALGQRPEAIEGKTEISFIPAYLTGFYNTIDTYIKNTLNWVSTEGVSLLGLNLPDQYIIQIPLINSGKKIIAVIGLSLKKEPAEEEIDNDDDYSDLINNLPDRLAVLSPNGVFKQVSTEFADLFGKNPEEFINIPYNSIFPAAICDKILLFLNERIEETKFDFNASLSENTGNRHTINIRRGRNNLFILIDKDVPEENLEQIINRRGIMFDILVQGNPQPVFIYDKENLRFLEVNDAALKLYGFRRDEFLQMDLTDLYTPEDIQSLLEAPSDPKKVGKYTGPYKHKKKDGSIVYVELSKISFRFNDSDAHFNIVKDVTETLELQDKSQAFKAVFENTEDLVFITDSSGFITYTNKAVQNSLGYLKRELENTSFAALTRNEERGMVNTTVFQATPRDVIILNIELKKADATFLKTEITATPAVNYKNEITSFTILGKYQKEGLSTQPPKEIIREVIKEVPAKEIIREIIVEKPVPVYRETSSSQKDNMAFLSSLFHDILTPINVIMGFVQELSESIEKPSPEQRESVDIINQNREGLLNIMNSIVEYSSIEKDTIELNIREIPVTEIIENIHSEVDPIIKARGIEFAYGRISSSLKFRSDKQRMLTFITLIVKMTANITREKKIYFSSFHWKENEFILSIKNNYASSTDYLVENLSQIFLKDETEINKDFGIPKLTIRLAKALLIRLRGRFEIIPRAESNDYGFVFPLDYTAAADIPSDTYNESFDQDIIDYIPEDEPEYQESVPGKDIVEQEKAKEIAAKEKAEAEEKAEKEKSKLRERAEQAKAAKEKIENEKAAKKAKAEKEIAELKAKAEKEIAALKAKAEKENEDAISDENETDSSGNYDEIIETEDILTTEELELESELSTIASGMHLKDAAEEKKMITSDRVDLSKLTCLYIEDQVDSQILFKVQMKDLKDIKFAVSFEEALPLLDNNRFDFIVIDINLQGEYNGIDSMKIIQKMPGYQNIPLIAVTAYVLPGDRDNFIQTGFNDFISKPIFREKMINSLEKVFLMQS